MAKKEKNKKDKFMFDQEFKADPIEVRRAEMQSILPGFYTVYEGVAIPSKQISAFSRSK